MTNTIKAVENNVRGYYNSTSTKMVGFVSDRDVAQRVINYSANAYYFWLKGNEVGYKNNIVVADFFSSELYKRYRKLERAMKEIKNQSIRGNMQKQIDAMKLVFNSTSCDCYLTVYGKPDEIDNVEFQSLEDK